MHVLESLHRNVKTVAMPSAMLVGAVLCRPVTALETWSGRMVTPVLIFLMLFVTFCRVRPSEMRLSMLHGWLLLFQTIACVGVYFLLLPLDRTVAQGAMICVLAPVAMAAVVIGGMLGANVATMATYSLLCNMTVALLAPAVLSFTGTGACSFAGMLARIVPLLVLPFAAAQCCRAVLPGVAGWVAAHSQISFYLWLVSLAVVIGRTTAFLIDLHDASAATELWLAAAALVICLVQFKTGRAIGRRYGDPAAGGQSLGQKNTVLAVWMAQSFLDPISSVAPTAYIVFQNFVNSYQIWRKDRNGRKTGCEPSVPCGCGERNRSVQRACGVFREALRRGRSCSRERSGAGKAGDGRRDGSRRRSERRKRRRENGDAAGEGRKIGGASGRKI